MKVVLWIVAILLLAVAGVGAYLYMNSGALLKDAIEEYGSEAAGVPVRVGSVGLDLVEGAGEIRNLTVANPPEFGTGNVMSIGLTRVGINVQETSETLVVLNELVVDGAALSVIARGNETNLEALQARVEAASGTDSAADDSTPDPKVIVDRLRITNTMADLQSDVLGEMQLPVPDVKLNNVGRPEGGITFEVLAERIISPITRDVTRELLRKGLRMDEAEAKAKEKVQSEVNRGLNRLREKLKLGD